MNPIVTVIIPTYNRAETIQRAIDSILRQTVKKIELIIVDDCSSDNTVQIINTYQDKRIKLICFSQNCGANAARNAGIVAANGEYIAFQDSDDEWVEDKLEVQLKYMNETGKKVCYCAYTLFQGNKKKIKPDYYDKKEMYEEKIVDILRQKNVISTQTLIIHKEIVEKIGMFDETMQRLQDYEFVIRICQHYEFAYINRPLVNVYRMDKCISNSNSALADAVSKIFIKHIDFIDCKSFAYLYLINCEWYNDETINFKWLDEILTYLKRMEKTEKVKQCLKIRESMLCWYNYFNQKIIGNEFIIYGAGVYGKKFYYKLKKAGAVPRCFWVTCDQEEKEIDGIPVLRIPDKVDKKTPVIIAINKETQGQLIDNLMSRGIKDYYAYPFAWQSDEEGKS